MTGLPGTMSGSNVEGQRRYRPVCALLEVSLTQSDIASKRGFVTSSSDHFHADNTIRFDDQRIVEIVNRGTDVARNQVERLANLGAPTRVDFDREMLFAWLKWSAIGMAGDGAGGNTGVG